MMILIIIIIIIIIITTTIRSWDRNIGFQRNCLLFFFPFKKKKPLHLFHPPPPPLPHLFQINLHTLKMARGNNVRCDISYVALYQATTLESDRRAKLCGDDEPAVMSLTSHSNRVFVRLYGNGLHTKPDLRMVYSMVQTGTRSVC